MTKVFFYYVRHTFVNTFKKLFHSWVIWVIAAVVGFSFLFGIGAAILSSALPESETPPEETAEEESDEIDAETAMSVFELVSGAVVFVYLGVAVAVTSRSVSGLFLMADVSTLFPAPVKPQSVLMFRTAMQITVPIAACFYLLFQLPNILRSVPLGVWGVVSLMLELFITAFAARILSIFFYIFGSKYKSVRWISTCLPFVIAAVVSGAFALYLAQDCNGVFSLQAVTGFFNSPISRMVPIWGWIKSMTNLAYEGKYLALVLSIIGSVAALFGVAFLTFKIRVDFYEDAIESASARQAQVEKARSNRGNSIFNTIKHKRSDKTNELKLKGEGASAFFWKAVKTRTRNATLGFITVQTILSTVLLVGIAAFTKFIVKTDSFISVFTAIGIIVALSFFKNPLGVDSTMNIFYLAPVNPANLVWNCMGGYLIDVIADYLPGIFLAEVLLGSNPLWPIVTAVMAISLSYFAASTAFFTDMLIPTTLHVAVRAAFQIWLFMLFAIPAIIGIVFFAIAGLMPIGFFFISLYNAAMGTVLLLLAPSLFRNGRQ